MATKSKIVGVLDEIDFPDVKDSIQQVLNSALIFVSDAAFFFQVSLIKRERTPGIEVPNLMTVRWCVRTPDSISNPQVEPIVSGKEPITYESGKSLLWDVIDAETKQKSFEWLDMYKTERFFDEGPPPPHVKRIYLANIKKAPEYKAIAVVSNPYLSSILVPIWVSRIRQSPLTKSVSDQLAGVLSLDSSLWPDKFLEASKKPPIRLVCSLTELVGRMIEAIDLAYYDFLAGDEGVLSSAFYFKKILQLITEDGEDLVLAYCDLNNFKSINDEEGHEEGNKVLSRFGAEVVQMCYNNDQTQGRLWLCRFGGDEFGLLAKGVNPKEFQSWLRDNLLKEFYLCKDKRHFITPSVGLASWRKVGEKDSPFAAAEKFRGIADDAMYASKKIYKDFNKQLAVILYDISGEQIKAIKEKRDLRNLLKSNPNGVKREGSDKIVKEGK